MTKRACAEKKTKDNRSTVRGRNPLSCQQGEVSASPIETHVGLDGRWIEVPLDFRRLLGYAKEEPFPDLLKDVIHPEDFPDYWHRCRRMIKEETPSFNGEMRYISRSGRVVWVYFRCSLVAGTSGDSAYICNHVCDITECKRVQMEFNEMCRRLEGKVKKRTLELREVNRRLGEEKVSVELHRVITTASREGAASKTLEAVLHQICRYMDYSLGHMYVFSKGEDKLVPADLWYPRHPRRFEALRRATMAVSFSRGEGIVGRVLSGGRPLWIVDVTRDKNFKRAEAAAKSGIRGALFFPILNRNRVAAVLEFFSLKKAEPSGRLLETMGYLGVQLGCIMERDRACRALEEKNTALQEVLKQIEAEKERVKDNVVSNIENLLFPLLGKLKRRGTVDDRRYVGLLEENLKHLTGAFGVRISEKKWKLTSREKEICNMIKSGMATKEIARLMNISLRTIEIHRSHIRRKLGLIRKKVNLVSYLQSF